MAAATLMAQLHWALVMNAEDAAPLAFLGLEPVAVTFGALPRLALVIPKQALHASPDRQFVWELRHTLVVPRDVVAVHIGLE